ncbi:MAG: hypothetical protein KJ923_00220 [Candidatus Omnitrophica bacterium]|nr:hypothetical protein [Candidatus Omnitrophota bacterium]
MIEINLLPEELQKKLAKSRKAQYKINTRYLLFIIPFMLGILICVHLYVGVLAIATKTRLIQLDRKWKAFSADRKTLESFNVEHSLMSEDAWITEQLIGKRIIWSEKLNKLSLHLPIGIWFTGISATDSDLALYGSVVSLEQDEVSSIKQFIDSLKSDSTFFNDFDNLEVNSVKSRKIGGYEIADFYLLGKLKNK